MFRKIIHAWDGTSFYLNTLVYYIGFAGALLLMLGYFSPVFFTAGIILLFCLLIIILSDFFLLYRKGRGLDAKRRMGDRMSNGDDNKIRIEIKNNYNYKLKGVVIDELPYQFQNRDWHREIELEAGNECVLEYMLTPQERGEYEFGAINIYVEGPLGMAKRRYIFKENHVVKVYPSYIQMRNYQLLATGAHMEQAGVKRMRKLGHSMEFEQIKGYVRGDDYRTINWKATARHGDLMVNNFTDERSQQIYCIINKGRVMKMPFGGMTLLDYAINASLVLLNIALRKQDKAGLITFGRQVDAFVPADKKPTQVNRLLDTLYNQETDFMEQDFEKLFSIIRNRITQRSLLILFTNFESFESLERELPTLKRLAHYHLLMVIFFENTELKNLTDSRVSDLEDIYVKTIAEKYRFEKQVIAKELQKNGIISVLTTPQKLTVNSLNKYLELKSRQSSF